MHAEAPESVAETFSNASYERFSVEVRRPRDNRADGSEEIFRNQPGNLLDIALSKRDQKFVQNFHRPVPRMPLFLLSQEVLFCDHFQYGADILGHAPVHQHQALLHGRQQLLWRLLPIEQLVSGQQPPPAHAELWISLLALYTLYQLQSRPQASRILPSPAAATQPLSQYGPRRNEASFRLKERTDEGGRLRRGAHARGDDRSQEVRGYREARSLGYVVHVRRELQAVSAASVIVSVGAVHRHHGGQQVLHWRVLAIRATALL
mmetsp:Transcript_24904/g.59964  ORF Transcript_24904/g.59964 Transcript_24904/m.59964 type:complete len:263 (-) Transcript_24904:1137-1925(-)